MKATAGRTARRVGTAAEAAAQDTAATGPLWQVVLVLQGGGALGAYQVGVFEATHQAGIEPDCVIGTSIGAINAALIAGNPPVHRLQRLQTFWSRVEQRHPAAGALAAFGLANLLPNAATVFSGIPGFFQQPNPQAWRATPDPIEGFIEYR